MEKSYLYLDLNKYRLKALNIKTEEIIENTLILTYEDKCITHIYSDRPILKYTLDDFILITVDNMLLPLKDFLYENKLLNEWYILLSFNDKILDIINFPVHLNEKYFTVGISTELKHFIESAGYDKFNFIHEFHTYSLSNLSRTQKLEESIIMFMDSYDPLINSYIINLKLKYLKDKFKKFKDSKVKEGLYLPVNNRIEKFTFYIEDQYWIDRCIQSNLSEVFLLNNLKNNFLKINEIYNLNYKLRLNNYILDLYEEVYFKYLSFIFTSDFSNEDLNKLDFNIFSFGYVNDYIMNELNYILQKEGKLDEVFK